MRLSDRGTPPGANAIAAVRADLAASGVTVTDLSDSNPTRHGLLHPGVLAAVERRIGDAAEYEPDPRGPLPAREALAGCYGGAPEDYWLASSTSQLYAWLAMVLTDPGEALAVPVPGYPLIPPIARLAGARTVEYRSHYAHGHGWVLDQESLTAALARPEVRAAVAVNPGNPTGAYPGAESLVPHCADRGLPIVADEVFGPFALDGTPCTLAGERRTVTFALGGLSKLLCAPQLKLAWLRLSGPAAELAEVREGLDAVADLFLPVSAPVAAALPELLTLAGESVTVTRARLAGNLATLRSVFAEGPYRVRQCDGGWTALLDVPRFLPSQDLVIRLLREAHLAVHPGWFYDLPDEGALALSLLPAPGEFGDGVGRLRAALDALGSTGS